jgi:hypothetical protein
MAEVTGLDPDAFACCPGTRMHECGCGGVTNAEVWAQRAECVPPIVEGPYLEQRPVGAWGNRRELATPPYAPDYPVPERAASDEDAKTEPSPEPVLVNADESPFRVPTSDVPF